MVDGLVSAVVGRDVLFIIYWLEQLPRDHIDDERESTSAWRGCVLAFELYY